MPSIPIVRQFTIVTKRKLRGKTFRASFKCPHCHAALFATEDEIGQPDDCPGCGGQFAVTPDATTRIREIRRETQAEADDEAEALSTARLRQQSERRQDQEKKERADAEIREARQAIKNMESEKERFRNVGVRIYPAVASIILWLRVLVRIVVVCAAFATVIIVIAMLTAAGTELNPQSTLIYYCGVLLLTIVNAVCLVFGFEMLAEMLALFVNLAQDTERILLLHEAEAGKPWAIDRPGEDDSTDPSGAGSFTA
jgi:DNA-directed RNA polymerase subunit M/transcription elongation factor TFIIS